MLLDFALENPVRLAGERRAVIERETYRRSNSTAVRRIARLLRLGPGTGSRSPTIAPTAGPGRDAAEISALYAAFGSASCRCCDRSRSGMPIRARRRERPLAKRRAVTAFWQRTSRISDADCLPTPAACRASFAACKCMSFRAANT
jgi:hypothetical protein